MWIFCIGFIDFMIKGKSFLGCINLFSHIQYEKKRLIDTEILLIAKNTVYGYLKGKNYSAYGYLKEKD